MLRYDQEQTAKQLWNEVKTNMAGITQDLQMKMMSKIVHIKMTNDENVDSYMNRAEGLHTQAAAVGIKSETHELTFVTIHAARDELRDCLRTYDGRTNPTMLEIRETMKEEERMKTKRDAKLAKEEVLKVKNQARNGKTCHNCVRGGHFARDCRSQSKCYNCDKYGHISTNCKEPKREERSYRGSSRGYRRGTRGRGRHESTMVASQKSNIKIAAKMAKLEDDDVSEEESKKYDVRWLLDSGATSHMSGREDMFQIYEEKEQIITTAEKGAELKASGIGQVVISENEDEKLIRLDVIHAKDLHENLMSIVKIVDHGYKVNFTRNGAVICNEDGEILHAHREDDKFVINTIHKPS